MQWLHEKIISLFYKSWVSDHSRPVVCSIYKLPHGVGVSLQLKLRESWKNLIWAQRFYTAVAPGHHKIQLRCDALFVFTGKASKKKKDKLINFKKYKFLVERVLPYSFLNINIFPILILLKVDFDVWWSEWVSKHFSSFYCWNKDIIKNQIFLHHHKYCFLFEFLTAVTYSRLSLLANYSTTVHERWQIIKYKIHLKYVIVLDIKNPTFFPDMLSCNLQIL